MQPRSLKSVEDIANACSNIVEWTVGGSLAQHESDSKLRAAVERTFEIIGEALLRLERNDPTLVARITDYRRVIGFRNRLAHGYDDIDDSQVWDIIQTSLPVLRQDIDTILAEIER
ncbi:MAG TPA: HepT-like ribonuclease domain-containing protein [Thermomicrobiales bacterium]|nr:HepT-like ribonuclease domain-containing protein [Thermomicrobiales bacterium]